MKSGHSMSRKRPTDIECTARHEAGHAVANYLMRRAFASVSVVSDDETVGRVASSKLPDWLRTDLETGGETAMQRARKVVEPKIICLYAGSVAEQVFKRKADHTKARKDYLIADELAKTVCASDAERVKYLKWLLQRTRDMLSLPWNWHAITVLAQELLDKKELNGRVARRIIRNAIEEWQLSHEPT